MNFFDQNSVPAISGYLANYTFRLLKYRYVKPAELAAGGGGATHFATSLYAGWCITEVCSLGIPISFKFLCILYDRDFVTRKKSIRQLPKSKSIHWTITPLPTLPCHRIGCLNMTTLDDV